ncbi:hypothetical protein [Parasphingorhabdus sp.]|uniref:hypothetical protein n=1 Tax=Parasphingorhabdus sp. TaxID=2709688 RepID=UPI003001BBF6
MINNFEVVKNQLSELSEVINKFKSEAVQLRIVEIVLGDGSFPKLSSSGAAEPPLKSGPSRRRKQKSVKTAAEPSNGVMQDKVAKKSRPSGQGAVAILSELADGSFFDQPKTLKDIVDYCEKKLARRFKANEFSGKLGRLTRDGVLDRNKNGDNQYEYTKI